MGQKSGSTVDHTTIDAATTPTAAPRTPPMGPAMKAPAVSSVTRPIMAASACYIKKGRRGRSRRPFFEAAHFQLSG
jgi:hypothetical protein